MIAQKKRQIIFTLEMEILNLDENLQQSLVTRTQTIRETSVAVKMMRKEEEKKKYCIPTAKVLPCEKRQNNMRERLFLARFSYRFIG